MTVAGTAAVPASDFGRDELTELWNRAYEGYFVPIAFDAQRFERHLRRAGVALALSRASASPARTGGKGSASS
jgi:hypothetical protein